MASPKTKQHQNPETVLARRERRVKKRLAVRRAQRMNEDLIDFDMRQILYRGMLLVTMLGLFYIFYLLILDVIYLVNMVGRHH